VNRGNVLDLQHFSDTYKQVNVDSKKILSSFLIKELNTADNIKIMQEDGVSYLT